MRGGEETLVEGSATRRHERRQRDVERMTTTCEGRAPPTCGLKNRASTAFLKRRKGR